MRPRIDLETHEIRGTKPQYVLGDSDTPAGKPKVPRNLSKDAKATFRRLARMLAQRRTLTAGDSEILRLYCVAFDRHSRAIEHLANEGEIVDRQRATKSGQLYDVPEKNMWLDIAQSSERYMRGLLSDLGLNPLQRSRVKQTVKKSDDDDGGMAPTPAETVLPEPPEISLDEVYAQYATVETPTESDEAQIARAEAIAARIMAEDD